MYQPHLMLLKNPQFLMYLKFLKSEMLLTLPQNPKNHLNLMYHLFLKFVKLLMFRQNLKNLKNLMFR
jgi:hypothetical protein